MQLKQIHHLLNEIRKVSIGRKLIIIGSQSAYASIASNDARIIPSRMLYSLEVDIAVLDDQQLMDTIEDEFGAQSPFHETYGYYADCVDIDLPNLPLGWEERLIPFYDQDCSAIEIHDCACAKLHAGREKDEFFIIEALKVGMLDIEILWERLGSMEVDPSKMEKMEKDLSRLNEEALENTEFHENEDNSVVFLFDPR